MLHLNGVIPGSVKSQRALLLTTALAQFAIVGAALGYSQAVRRKV